MFENKDIYQDEPYIPNEVFNIDSFPIALSINLFLYNFLYIAFPNKISGFEISDNVCDIFSENDTYYLYCNKGHKSTRAVNILSAYGYKVIKVII